MYRQAMPEEGDKFKIPEYDYYDFDKLKPLERAGELVDIIEVNLYTDIIEVDAKIVGWINCQDIMWVDDHWEYDR